MNVYNYNHLYYFFIVAKLSGVTAAAKHLNTSQSSLSTQIKALEAALDKKLFRKSGRKIELTENGKDLFNYCRRAFGVFDEMFAQLERKSTGRGLRISIGVSAEMDRPFVSETLAKTIRMYPKMQQPQINLVSLPIQQLTSLLLVGELDLLLGPGSPTEREIQILSQIEFPIGVFASSKLIRSIPYDLESELSSRNQLPFVLPSKSTELRNEIDRYFLRKKISPECVFESNIFSAVVRATQDGMGATLLPSAYLAKDIQLKKIVQLNFKPLWKQQISVQCVRQSLTEGRADFAQKLIQQLKRLTTERSLDASVKKLM